MVTKSAEAFRTISEVAEWLDVPTHVLRFWESKFTQVKPVKRAGGRRYYRPDDMLLLGGIRKLLHEDGMTIKGVQRLLREDGAPHVAALSAPLDDRGDARVIEHPATRPRRSAPSAPQTKGDERPAPAEAKGAKTQNAPSEEMPSEPVGTGTDQPAGGTEQAETDAQHSFWPADESARGVEKTPVAPDEPPETPPEETPPEETPAQHVGRHGPAAEDEEPTDRIDDTAQASNPEDEARETSSPAPRPDLPDLPDDPGDDAPADAGPLSRLANLPRPLPSAMAQRAAPYHERLRDLRSHLQNPTTRRR